MKYYVINIGDYAKDLDFESEIFYYQPDFDAIMNAIDRTNEICPG